MSVVVDNQQDSRHLIPKSLSAHQFRSDENVLLPKTAQALNCSSGTQPILIVDDDTQCLELVSKMATCLGYKPTMAINGKVALDHLSRADYYLVITDYDMPVVDGRQLADQIRKHYFETQVIMMTGHWAGDVDDLLDAGVIDGLLFKPFSLNVLREKIEMVCRLNKHHLQIQP